LSIHPEVVKRLREEHERVFHRDMAITLDYLRESPHKTNELEYTTAVIKETLRMFPVGFGVRVSGK
jgi:cytochrome P450